MEGCDCGVRWWMVVDGGSIVGGWWGVLLVVGGWVFLSACFIVSECVFLWRVVSVEGVEGVEVVDSGGVLMVAG